MSGANTRSVLGRFGDSNWEKGEDFVKTFYVKKLVWEMEGTGAGENTLRRLALFVYPDHPTKNDVTSGKKES